MRDLTLPAFLLAAPPLAVLGHDIYMAYNNTGLPVAERFYLSDLGWLWTAYSPDSYQWALDNIDAMIWNGVIDPLLQQSALYVCGAPLVVFLCGLLVFRICGLGPFAGRGVLSMLSGGGSRYKKNKGFAFDRGAGKGRAKYKRR